MNSFKKHDLHEGRLGRPRINLQREPPNIPNWSVPRALKDLPLCLVPITAPVTTIPASFAEAPDVSTNLEPKLNKKIERERQIRSICATEPYLAPAAALLSDLLQVSPAVSDAGDATFSNVLSVGRTFDQRSRKSVGIIAVPAGIRGQLLRLDLLVEHPFASATASGPEAYTTWKIVPGRSGLWNHRSTQVRQIEFATDRFEYGSFLGARFQASLALFRPVPRIEALRPEKNALVPGEEAMPASYIDPGYFAEITAEELSGSSFAHFSFHPSSQQIGVIDTFGNWATWSFKYEHKTNTSFQSRPSLSVRGWLRGDFLARSNYDGWARFLWSSDGSVFLAVRRRNAAVYTTGGAGRPLRTPRIVDFRQEESRDWVVDAKQCPLRPRSIWLLTSHRLISVSVTAPQSAEEHYSEPKVEIDLTQIHFAQGGDVDLSLDFVNFPDALVAMIHGKTGSPLFTYIFRESQTQQFRLISSNTGLIRFTHLSRLGVRPEAASSPFVPSLAFAPVVRSDNLVKDVFPSSRVLSGSRVRLLYCSGDLSVSETTISLDVANQSRPPIMHHIPRSRSTSVTSAKSVCDDFVVDDGMISDDPDDILPFGSFPIKRIERVRRPNYLQLSWFLALFDEFARDQLVDAARTLRASNDSGHSVNIIEEALDDASRGQSDLAVGSHTFSEAFGSVSYDEFKAIAGSLRGLLQNTFDPVDSTGDLVLPTVTFSSLMNPCGLAWWPTAALIHGDASALFEHFHAVTSKVQLPTVNGEIHPSLFDLARHLAMRDYLNLYKITIAIAPEALSFEDTAKENGTEPIQDTVEGRHQDKDGLSSSSPPPLPDSDDLFQRSGTSDLRPPVSRPHPLAVLTNLEIVSSTRRKTYSDCARLFDQWTEGEMPSGQGLGLNLNLPSVMSNTPKPKPTKAKQTPREELPANKVRIVEDTADTPSSPRAVQIFPGSSQLPIRSQPSSSQVAVASTAPRSSQFRSTQGFASSQAGPSQSQKTKRRKAGF